MELQTAEKQTQVVPQAEDIAAAKSIQKKLAALAPNGTERYRLMSNEGDEIPIPEAMFQALAQVIDAMADGQAIMIVPGHAELSTQQAADLLNVSRPYLVRLLDEGRIACRMVGRYRRVRYEDLRKYQRDQELQRLAAMEEMAAQAQSMNLGY